MTIAVPPVSAIRAELELLSHRRVQALAQLSGVPFGTIWKIRDGATRNPGMDTVRQFASFIEQAYAMELPPQEVAHAVA